MIRVSRLADYAVLIIAYMSYNEGNKFTASSITKSTGLTLHTVNKILSLLVKKKIIKGERGPKGGYMLLQNSNNISMRDLVEAIDGPVALTICVDDNDSKCNLYENCLTRDNWEIVNNVISDSLSKVKISQMRKPGIFINEN